MRQGQYKILHGDVRDMLRTLPDETVQTTFTSPPYWGLRDYGVDGQIGLEPVPDCLGWATGQPCGECYVCHMREVFTEVYRVTRLDGTLWLNLGDSYAGSGKGGQSQEKRSTNWQPTYTNKGNTPRGYKPKDLIGIPWRVAFALQVDGWYLRSDIIWSKPNPMPESVKDRPTKSHEYVFLFSKSQRYYYDQDAILEPVSPNTHARVSQNVIKQVGSDRANGGKKTNGNMKAVVRTPKQVPAGGMNKNNDSFNNALVLPVSQRNKRSVWVVATQSYSEAHFATFPEALPEIGIKAGSKEGDIVLDPFNGSGTTGAVAVRLGRDYVGCELNADYINLSDKRIGKELLPMLSYIQR